MFQYKLITDLDGVLRSLNETLGKKYGVPLPQNWKWTYKNKDIFQWMEYDNYEIIGKEAPKTKYCELIEEELNPLEVWTCQPNNWKKHTFSWIANNLPNIEDVFILDTKGKRKKLDENKEYILIEDSPNFKSYERIILIDAPYNRYIDVKVRIKSVEELKEVFNKLKNGEWLW